MGKKCKVLIWTVFPNLYPNAISRSPSMPAGPMALSPPTPWPKQTPDLSFVHAPERRRSAWEQCRAAQAGDLFPHVREPDFVHLSCPSLLPFWDEMDQANPKYPQNDHVEVCTAHQPVSVFVSAGWDEKTNENPSLSTGHGSR